jgi:alpha-L-fucosidase
MQKVNLKFKLRDLVLASVVLFSAMSSFGQGPDPSLKLHYTFDSLSTDKSQVIDASGNGFSGTFKNGATIKKVGNYSFLDLGANNGYLDLGSAVGSVISSLTSFSIATYLFVDETANISGGSFIWTFANSNDVAANPNGQMFFSASATRYAISQTNWSGESGLNYGREFAQGIWKHITYTQSGNTGTIYIDGVAVKTGIINKQPKVLGATAYNYIGRSPYLADAYLKKSLLYDFRLYNRALTATDVSALDDSLSSLNKDILQNKRYDTVQWSTLKNYETPEWYRDAKFGIYPHFGVYSVAAFGNEWYGYAMYDKLSQSPSYVPKTMYPHHVATYGDPGTFGYKDLIPLFKAQNFNADTLMSYIANAGAKYFAHLTSHHDSYLMYGSKISRWNCVDMGPKKDIGLLFQAAAKKQGLRFGISNHLAENDWFFQFNWHNNFDVVKDTSLWDLYNDYNSSIDLNNTAPSDRWCKRWVAISEEMIDYFKPDYIYYDRGWSMHPKWTPYRKTLAAYQYNKAIEWGRGVYGAPGVALLYKDLGIVAGGAILDYENGVPSGKLDLPFQNDVSISDTWGYVENDTYKSAATLVNRLVDVVSKNGNLMLSINPKADGTLPPITKQRLAEIGSWLKINGEAIYATRPAETFGYNNGTNQIRFTTNKDTTIIYIFSSNWPGNNAVFNVTSYNSANLDSAKISKITLLGNGETNLKWTQSSSALSITMPSAIPTACNYCYVFKMYLDKATTTLARPSNLTSTSTGKAIALKWVNSSSKATGFAVERKDNITNTFTKITTVSNTVTTYTDLDLLYNVFYVYRVRAYDANGYSNYSNESTGYMKDYTTHDTTAFCEGDSIRIGGVYRKTAGSYTSKYTSVLGGDSTVITELTIKPLPPKPTITQTNEGLLSSATTGNQWYNEGAVIPGAVSQSYTPGQAGNFSVVVSDNGCYSKVSDIFHYTTTAVNPVNNSNEKYKVYSRQNIIVIENVMNSNIELFDTKGVLQYANKETNKNIYIPVKPGMYIVKINKERFKVVAY